MLSKKFSTMEISEIKSRLSILQVAKHYGLDPNKYDMVKCPFHEDKNPSLKLYYETNTFNCFSCSANGDVIEFIQLIEQCTKHQAIIKAKFMLSGAEVELLSYETKINPIKNQLESWFIYYNSI